MSKPRAAQLELLTRGVVLPLRALHPSHISLVLGEVREAWSELLRLAPQVATNDPESGISAWLEIKLNQRLGTNQRFRQLVSSIARGRESLAADGHKHEKRPDLNFQLTRRNSNFPLTVECKILDRRSNKHIGLYCNDGLRRFVCGEYGWWAQEGIMLAYVRDGSSFSDCLEPRLKSDRISDNSLQWEEPLTQLIPEDTAITRHGRSFELPNGAPGPVIIWHLWLQVS